MMDYSKERRGKNSSDGRAMEEIELVEEGGLRHPAGCYYPVKIGKCLNRRYRVLGKVGYCISSTVWFCRDQRYGMQSRSHV